MFEGYGRTDATQRIANTVFGRHISPDNYRPATAPVSYPHLWDIAKFDWVQWEGYASQPMARNINESLGVGARLDLFDEFGAPLPLHLRYDTSIHPDRLHEIERTLATLQAPRWPEPLFGRIDEQKARAGRVLFDVHCRHCHGPHLTAHDTPPPDQPPPDPNLDVNIEHNADGSCELVKRVADDVGAGGHGQRPAVPEPAQSAADRRHRRQADVPAEREWARDRQARRRGRPAVARGAAARSPTSAPTATPRSISPTTATTRAASAGRPTSCASSASPRTSPVRSTRSR